MKKWRYDNLAIDEHDVVVVGAGHNGLIVATYLAKAGLDVCLVELQDKVGGAIITRELTLPGFKHDQGGMMHVAIPRNPLIADDELGLISKYGLKYIFPEQVMAMPFPDGRALVIYRDLDKTCESIAQFSQKDAEAYPKFYETALQLSKEVAVSMFSPPPSFGQYISSLEASEDGREYLRILLSSIMDIACEWFESEHMRVAMVRYAAEIMIDPLERGCGARILSLPLFQKFGIAFPEGGAGKLTEALAECVKDYGGTIRLSSPVKSIKIDGGEARGVILEDGEEILAKKAVISNLNVKQLFLEMIEPEVLPSGFVEKVRRIKPDPFSGVLQVFALNEAPKFRAGGDTDETPWIEICPFMEGFIRILHEIQSGTPPVINTPFLCIHTLADPTRAPEGKHTLGIYQFEPYHLKDGGAARWDEIKQDVADGILETVREYTTNMGPENILGRWICSPLDLERYNPTVKEGSIHQIGQALSQWMPNRPLPGWTHYRTPVKMLYMCGASTHPGPAVTGGGRTSVQVIMEDLGIDFKKVIAK